MIVVDTSVWIDAFRGKASVKRELTRLLDEDLVALTFPVRMEILSGARRGELGAIRRALSALPVFLASDAAWHRAEAWVDVATKANERFGVLDLVIAAIAAEENASMWSLDADFERMAKLRFVRLHRPPGASVSR